MYHVRNDKPQKRALSYGQKQIWKRTPHLIQRHETTRKGYIIGKRLRIRSKQRVVNALANKSADTHRHTTTRRPTKTKSTNVDKNNADAKATNADKHTTDAKATNTILCYVACLLNYYFFLLTFQSSKGVGKTERRQRNTDAIFKTKGDEHEDWLAYM